ncbi:hypothetical protein A5791_13805 [Mycobacterium sp. 852002-51163_SCH5372311]|uniref:sulfatase-like hydrolase/transferase n=1 Tax=Mycobacterium sp. 852002-51163_SCH5372311 TaxID=1834097 RepID=UPI0008010414|nr:hypothetical protein A5791_13805 [Mycobacterium sp. 852002-51163_SCH5372311]
MPDGKPNILVIWGDDIGITNLSCYSDGLMGYRTPNIDRIANEGMRFTDSYGEQSCTAGRAAFISGQSVYRTGMSQVGAPGFDIGWAAADPTIAELLKPLGYATGQFGKNHFGDLNKYLPTVHGFDRPILAVGNSNGDIAMLQYTHAAEPSLCMLVRHDDADREFDYATGAEKALGEANTQGWTVVSIREDWVTVFET